MNGNARGSTLIVVLLLSSVMAMAGLALAIVAQQERRLSILQSRELRLRRAALDAVQVGVLWFAHPDRGPKVDQVLRSRLPVNPLNPGGPPLSAVGEYKAGMDLDEDGDDDLFHPPYRDEAVHLFLGHRDHPDLTVVDLPFLLDLGRDLFGSGEVSAAERRRVERMDLYAPPIVRVGGEWRRHGIATLAAAVVLERRQAPGRYTVVARQTARGVVQQLPYRFLAGPMVESCASLSSRGGWSPRWGEVRVGGDLSVENLPHSIPAGLPHRDTGDLWTDDAAWIAAFNAAIDPSQPVPDPWMRIAAGGGISAAPSADVQPWPHSPPPIGASAPWSCCGYSHIRQWVDQPICSPVDYLSWKSLSQSALRGTAYYEWVAADRYRDSSGVVRSVQQILEQDAREGLLRFFDTMDRLPPTDSNGDGRFDNLTPEVSLSGTIALRGLLLMNSQHLKLRDLDDSLTVALQVPREPAVSDGSAWIDLQLQPDRQFYPGGPTEHAGDAVRIDSQAAMEGTLIQAGDLSVLGRGTVVGRIRARNITMEVDPEYSRIYPIPALKDRGVALEWQLPSFVIDEIGVDGG